MNCLFKKRQQRRWIWKFPNGQTTNKIDYILAKNLDFVADVSVLQKCNTGSAPVRATLKLPILNRRHAISPRKLPPTFNRLQLQISMWLQEIFPNATYKQIILAIKNKKAMKAAEQKTKRTRRISNPTKFLMAERQAMRFGTGRTLFNQVKYAAICKTVRWSLEERGHSASLCQSFRESG